MISDKFFIETAKLLAEESKCISLQVGAVIAKDNRIISIGYNGTVSGTINCNEALELNCYEKENHSDWSTAHEIHAEMNAIMFAAKYGISVKDATLYCTHEPCDNCLKNIIQAGIKRIVYLHPYKKENCQSFYRYYDSIIEIEQYEE